MIFYSLIKLPFKTKLKEGQGLMATEFCLQLTYIPDLQFESLTPQSSTPFSVSQAYILAP